MSTRARRISQNFLALSVAQLGSRVFTVATTIHLARTLGVENFGLITLAVAIVAYPGLVVRAGFQRLGPREIVRHPEQVQALTRTILSLRLLLATVAFAVLALLVWLLPNADLTRHVLLLYGLSLFAMAIDLTWVFIGTETMHYAAASEIITQVVMAAGALILVRGPEHIEIVPLVYLVSQFAGMGLVVLFYVRHFGPLRLGIDWQFSKPLLRAAWPLALSSGMAMITFNFDTVMVGAMLGTQATGYYGAAYQVIWMPSMLIAIYFNALNPSLDRAFTEGLKSIETLLNKSMRLMGVVGLGLGVGGTLLAVPGFNYIYGLEYHDAVMPFQILIWSIALMCINRNYRTLLISFDRERAQFRMMGIAAVFNIVLNLLLIPLFGLPGAALATFFTEMSILVVGYIYTQRYIGRVPFNVALSRIGLAAVIMGIILLVTGPMHLFIRIAVSIGGYAISLLMLRAITFKEVQHMIMAWFPRRTARA